MASVDVEMNLKVAGVVAGLEKVRGEMKSLKAYAKSEGAGIGSALSSGFSSLIPALGAGAIVAKIHAIAEGFDKIADTADALNASTDGVQRLAHMAAGTNTPLEVMTGGLIKIRRAIMDVDNEAKQSALAKLGLDAQSFIGLDADKQFLKLAAAYKEAQASGKGFAEVMALIKGASPDLFGALNTSADALEEMSRRAIASAETIEMFTTNLGKAKMAGMEFSNWAANSASGIASLGEALWAGLGSVASGGNSWDEVTKKAAEMGEAATKAAEAKQKARKLIADAEKAENEKRKQYQQDDRDDAVRKAEDGLELVPLSAAEKLLKVQTELNDLAFDLDNAEGRLKDDINFRTKKQMELVALMKEEDGLKKKAQNQKEALVMGEAELQVKELRNKGRNWKADKIQKAMDEEKEFQKNRDARPDLGEDWARKLAKRKIQADEDAKNPGKIRGFKPEEKEAAPTAQSLRDTFKFTMKVGKENMAKTETTLEKILGELAAK